MNKLSLLKITGVNYCDLVDGCQFCCVEDCTWCLVYFIRLVFWLAMEGFMTENFFHDTIIRVKYTAMNEISLHWVFVEKTVDDWNHG